MDGFGSHTFQWVNAEGQRFWVKFHFKTDQGIQCLSDEESVEVAGSNPQAHQVDLLQSIERGDFPSWTLKVQVMPDTGAAEYRYNPFDLTKVWPHGDYPLIEVGKLVLDRNPESYFNEVEQVALSPANFVPGIGPSPDKMLQGRLFGYGDAQRYRLGVNHTQLPVNAPKAVEGGAANYGRDGAMSVGEANRAEKNYEPNSCEGPVEANEPLYADLDLAGTTGATVTPRHPEDDDFVQAGALFRIMPPDEQERVVQRIAGGLAQVDSQEVVDRSISHFRNADSEYGARIEAAVKSSRA